MRTTAQAVLCYYYPDRITVRGNTIMQHVRHSKGVLLRNVDASGVAPVRVTNNIIEATNKIAPVGILNPSIRAIGIVCSLG